MTHYRCKTTLGYWATVSLFKWQRNDFAFLGHIEMQCRDAKPPRLVPWAWHEDGRSIDIIDRAFDLIDFPQIEAPKPFFWLGVEAEKACR